MKDEFSELLKLGQAERLQLVEDLWDSIAQDQQSPPIPEWKREELRRRHERLLQEPDSGRTWEEIKRRIRESND